MTRPGAKRQHEQADQRQGSRRLALPASLVCCLLVSLLLWAIVADRFSLSIDEGIYLTGAERVSQGGVPHRDFFALTGPGTFWRCTVSCSASSVRTSRSPVSSSR